MTKTMWTLLVFEILCGKIKNLLTNLIEAEDQTSLAFFLLHELLSHLSLLTCFAFWVAKTWPFGLHMELKNWP